MIVCPITQIEYQKRCTRKECLYWVESKTDLNCGQKMSLTQIAFLKGVTEVAKKANLAKTNISRCIILYEMLEHIKVIEGTEKNLVDRLTPANLNLLSNLLTSFPFTWTKEWSVNRLCLSISKYDQWAARKKCVMPLPKILGVSPEDLIKILKDLNENVNN